MMRMQSILFRAPAIVIAAIFAMTFGMQAQAASCKGKSKSSCSSAANCSWVNGYKRSDGVKVSGHCRAKAGKGATKSAFGKKTANKAKSKAASKKDKLKKDKKSKKDKLKKAKKSTKDKAKSKKDKSKSKKDKKKLKDKLKKAKAKKDKKSR